MRASQMQPIRPAERHEGNDSRDGQTALTSHEAERRRFVFQALFVAEFDDVPGVEVDEPYRMEIALNSEHIRS